MKRLFMAGLLAISLSLLNSCGQQNRVDELKDFVEKVQEEGGTYTAQQWEEVNEQFSKLLEKLNSYEDLTPEELKELARLQGEYAATVFKSQTGETLEKIGAMMDGFLNGLAGDSDEEATQQPQDEHED